MKAHLNLSTIGTFYTSDFENVSAATILSEIRVKLNCDLKSAAAFDKHVLHGTQN